MGGIVSSVIGGVISAKGANKAAKTQAAAANRAAQNEVDMYNQNREDLTPYRAAGTNALDLYQRATTGKGFKYGDEGQVIEGEYVDVTDEDRFSGFEKSPGYQFRLDEGRKMLENSASARGTLYSGAQLKALTRYGQDYASGEFSNWLNQLGVLSGIGQTATNNTAMLGAQSVGNQNNALMAAADARASGYVGKAGAWTNVLNQVGGMANNWSGGGASAPVTNAPAGMGPWQPWA
jgi:hypothetical protein